MTTLAALAVALVAGYALIRFSFRAARHTHQRGDHPNGRCWICGASMPQEPTMHATDHLLPIATLNDGRPYRLFNVEGIQVVDGERCVVGLWVNDNGTRRALVRVATIYDPEGSLT